jgi:hypothetical protein
LLLCLHQTTEKEPKAKAVNASAAATSATTAIGVARESWVSQLNKLSVV